MAKTYAYDQCLKYYDNYVIGFILGLGLFGVILGKIFLLPKKTEPAYKPITPIVQAFISSMTQKVTLNIPSLAIFASLSIVTLMMANVKATVDNFSRRLKILTLIKLAFFSLLVGFVLIKVVYVGYF